MAGDSDMLDLANDVVNQAGLSRRSSRATNGAGRSHRRKRSGKPHAEGAARREQRRRPDGGAAAERRPGTPPAKAGKPAKKSRQGVHRRGGNADADRRKEACEGVRGEEAGSQAAEVGLTSK